MTDGWLHLRIVGLALAVIFAWDLVPHQRLYTDDGVRLEVHGAPQPLAAPVLVRWTVSAPMDAARLRLDGEPIPPSGERWIDPARIVVTMVDRPAAEWALRAVETHWLSNTSAWLVILGLLAVGLSLLPASRRPRLPKGRRALLACVVPALALLLAQAALATPWQQAFVAWPGQHYSVASTLLRHGVYGWTIEQMEQYGIRVGADWAVTDRGAPLPSAWTYPAYTLVVAGTLAVERAAGVTPPRDGLGVFWINEVLIGVGVALTAAALFRAGLTPVAVGLVALGFVRTGWPAANSFHITSEPLLFLINAAALVTWVGFRRSDARWGLAPFLVLGALAGVGQVTKPVIGVLVPAGLAIHALLMHRAHWKPAVLAFLVVASVPTGIWVARNMLTLGAPVATSTAASFFVVQGLDPALEMPPTLGRNEVENDALTREKIWPRIRQLAADPSEVQALIDGKLYFFLPSVVGQNQARNPRWMTPWASDVAPLAIVLGIVAIGVVALVRPRLVGADVLVLAALIAGWWLFHLLTQPLSRYFPPITPLYVGLFAAALARGVAIWRERHVEVEARVQMTAAEGAR